jgi:hypothetical protein
MVAAILSLLAQTPAQAQPKTINSLEAGNIKVIEIEKNVSSNKGNLKAGNFLKEGAVITTAGNSGTLLLFDTGAAIKLDANSSLEIRQFAVKPFDSSKINYSSIKIEPTQSKTLLLVKKGTVTIKVPKLNPESTFVIETPLGRGEVKGTIIGLNVDDRASTFVVTEGSLKVTKLDNSHFVLDGSNGINEASSNANNDRTARQNNPVVISVDKDYTPSTGLISTLTQGAQNLSGLLNQTIPSNAMQGAPQQQTDPASSTGDQADSTTTDANVTGPDAQNAGPASNLPAPFGGGGGGGGGGTIYSR